jgi:RNA polymerase sigma-70 factor, ECF subfamily
MSQGMETRTGSSSGVPPCEPPRNAQAAAAVDPAQWVETYADPLYRQALLRVRDPATAQDLVQEVFLAAWRGRQSASKVRSEKAWLLGILKNKIADYYRQQSRRNEFHCPEELSDFEASQFDQIHPQTGHWRVGPREWSGPALNVERAEFWQVLHECTRKLPAQTARVFVLREVDEIATDEICRTLHVQQNHVFVMLHRARLALRRCLELNWFDRQHGVANTEGTKLC